LAVVNLTPTPLSKGDLELISVRIEHGGVLQSLFQVTSIETGKQGAEFVVGEHRKQHPDVSRLARVKRIGKLIGPAAEAFQFAEVKNR